MVGGSLIAWPCWTNFDAMVTFGHKGMFICYKIRSMNSRFISDLFILSYDDDGKDGSQSYKDETCNDS